MGFRLTSLLHSSKVRLAILIIYWILGFVVTHMPLRESGEVLIPNLDKLAHFLLYGGLGFLMAIWLGTGKRTGNAVAKTLCICAIYALLDEGLQYFVPTRNASFYDLIADMLGAMAGTMCYGFLRKNLFERTNSGLESKAKSS